MLLDAGVMNQSRLHKFLPQHALSRIAGWFADRRWGAVTRWVIRIFIRRYKVDMKEALQEDYRSYPTFNAFFTRHLKSDLRPIVSDSTAIASPVDGVVSEMGDLQNVNILQAKNRFYTVDDLLGGNSEHAALFRDGHFLTAYLAPKNYHRIHMPIDGRLLEMIHVPGRLFSVNAASVEYVPNLFARNERVVCLFETKAGLMAMVMVGAMIVGSINTVWHGTVTPPTKSSVSVWGYREENFEIQRGQEVGHFKMGSTVIVLFQKNKIQWNLNFKSGQMIHYGEMMGALR